MEALLVEDTEMLLPGSSQVFITSSHRCLFNFLLFVTLSCFLAAKTKQKHLSLIAECRAYKHRHKYIKAHMH